MPLRLIITIRIINGIMKAAALLPDLGRPDNQLPDIGNIPEFQDIRSHQIIEIILADLFPEVTDPSGSSFEPLIGSNDSDIIPHTGSNLIPVMFQYNTLITRYCGPVFPTGNANRPGIIPVHLRQMFPHLSRTHQGLQQGITG
jgi:hypothetical protein